MGIEQSYLSKLENGKPIPFGDVTSRILDVFNLEVGDLVDDLDQNLRYQLRQIPAVAEHFNQQKRLIIGDRRRWLLLSTFLLAIGISLIYAGHTRLFAPGVVYSYRSTQIDRPIADGAEAEL